MLVRIFLILTVSLTLPFLATAQAADGTSCYWIYFRDKNLSASDRQQALVSAEQNLTPRAHARREKNHVPLADDYDLPVAPAYIEQVQATGVRIRTVSQWPNAVSVETTPAQVAQIGQLPCISNVEPFRLQKVDMTPRPQPRGALDYDYGSSFRQDSICHIPELHARGLYGQGVMIGFLDSGYRLTHRAFDSLHIVARYDFVHNDTTVQYIAGEDSFGQDWHGTQCLSACAGLDNGHLVGPAIHADYLLAKTEWVPTETHAEEDYFVAGLEWCDAHGADVISSSLGYNGTPGDMWYTFQQLDGHTAPTTRGFEVAAAHGILCVNAAGNERHNTEWPHIVTPADADSILAVGGVNPDGQITYSSSPGPTGDGRIKPEVCALGVSVNVAVVDTTPGIDYGSQSGTSVAAPMVAGAAALIMEAHPTWTAQMVRQAIMSTASNAGNPNNDYGWGIVNALAAADYVFEDVPDGRGSMPRSTLLLSSYPNPVNGTVTLTLSIPNESSGNLVIYDLLGRAAFTWPQTRWAAGEQHVTLSTEGFNSGIYFARFEGTSGHATQKLVILK